jgi:hypothetical protein
MSLYLPTMRKYIEQAISKSDLQIKDYINSLIEKAKKCY